MAEVVVEHERRDPERRGRGRDDAQEGGHGVRVDQVVREDEERVADRLGAAGGLADGPGVAGVAGIGEESEGSGHGRKPAMTGYQTSPGRSSHIRVAASSSDGVDGVRRIIT